MGQANSASDLRRDADATCVAWLVTTGTGSASCELVPEATLEADGEGAALLSIPMLETAPKLSVAYCTGLPAVSYMRPLPICGSGEAEPALLLDAFEPNE